MFKPVEPKSFTKFNSDASCDLLTTYEQAVRDRMIADSKRIPHKTFAPSAFRCDRISWFRLRGTEPDEIKHPDSTYSFIAESGTACHRYVQSIVSDALGADWICVQDYFRDHPQPYEISVESSDTDYESIVNVTYPPVKFACDGIIKLNNKYYLFEIKSCESSTWSKLSCPKAEHTDQVKLYSKLIGIRNVLFLYIDRQYGQVKVFEYCVTDSDIAYVDAKIDRVLMFVDRNLAPEGLPDGDKWCNENYCQYYNKCKSYGKYRYE